MTTKTRRVKAWAIVKRGELIQAGGFVIYPDFNSVKGWTDDIRFRNTHIGVPCEITNQIPSKH